MCAGSRLLVHFFFCYLYCSDVLLLRLTSVPVSQPHTLSYFFFFFQHKPLMLVLGEIPCGSRDPFKKYFSVLH